MLNGVLEKYSPYVRLMLLLAAVMFSCKSSITQAADQPAIPAAEKPQLMFVQTAEDFKVDAEAKTFRLVNVSQQTVYFSDRPVRIGGHLKMAEYLKEWTAKAGMDNFAKDPPNATISVYEPGQPDNTIAVVTITNPQIDGRDLVYSYKVIEGKLPASGGPTALFIDWIGVGGGVGFGFHGIGVGARGFGRF